MSDENKIWVLTEAYNEYDQHGDYLLCAWRDKPTPEQVSKALNITQDGAVDLIKTGGGRDGVEHHWYYLKSINSGDIYESDY
jgi:hypothetical protein